MPPRQQTPLELVTLPVPPEDVGRLIGRNGQQIKQIRERSQCSVAVETVNAEKPVVIIKGTSSNILVAKRLIAEICGGEGVVFIRDVDESSLSLLTRNGWLQETANQFGVAIEVRNRIIKVTVPEGSDASVADRFREAVEKKITEESAQVEERISCTAEALKRIKEDPGVKQLVSSHFLKMTIAKTERETLLQLQGQKAIVEEAVVSIKAIIDANSARDFVFTVACLCDGAPEQKLDDLLNDIHEGVELKHGVQVTWSPGSTNAVIEGPAEAIPDAKEHLEQVFQYYFHLNCASIPMPLSSISAVCGQDDQNLIRLRSAELVVTVDRFLGRLWICGAQRPATNAYERFTGALLQWNAENLEIPLTEGRHAGWIMGPRGETIKKIQEKSKAMVSIDAQRDGSQVVRIKGTPETIQAAKREIEAIIRQGETNAQQQQYHHRRRQQNFGQDASRHTRQPW